LFHFLVYVVFKNVVPRLYRHWWVTLVAASSFNSSFFGESSSFQVPDALLTLANATLSPFVTCAVIAKGRTRNVYKCFSNEDLTGTTQFLFSNITEHHVFCKKQFLSPTSSFQPIVLPLNVVYLSAMESVAVAMEGSVIAGKNAAKLVKKMLAR
jgi:hypothetical protein